jgi:hypothetical protein
MPTYFQTLARKFCERSVLRRRAAEYSAVAHCEGTIGARASKEARFR